MVEIYDHDGKTKYEHKLPDFTAFQCDIKARKKISIAINEKIIPIQFQMRHSKEKQHGHMEHTLIHIKTTNDNSKTRDLFEVSEIAKTNFQLPENTTKLKIGKIKVGVLEYLVALFKHKAFKQLKTITFEKNLPNLNDDKLAIICKACPNLKTLILQGNFPLYDQKKWLQYCGNLQTLSLSPSLITESMSDYVDVYCPKLQSNASLNFDFKNDFKHRNYN